MTVSRTVRLGAALAAAALALTACAGGPTAPETADGSAKIRFTWWGNPARAEATRAIVDAFMVEHPEIKVVTEPGDFSGYFDKLATQVAANDAPDLITMGGAYLPEYAGRNVLLDLGTVAEQFDTSKLDVGAIDNGRVGGVHYGATTGVNALSVLVNTKVFADAGVALPDDETWTWDDYASIAKQVQSSSPSGVYGAAGGLTHDSIDAWARQRGELLYTADGKLGLTRGTIADYFQYSLDLVQQGGAPQASIITEQVNVPVEQHLLATNQAGMAIMWSNLLSPATTAAGGELKIMKLPGESVNKPGIWLQSSQFFTINAKTTYPKQTAMLLDYLLNSTDAGKIVLTDRGVPTNADVREAIAPSLSVTGRAEVDYIARIGALDLQPTYVGPTGSTQVQDITNRAMAAVLFGQLTPAQAADQWFSEAEAAIA